jgi:hypothetical protein
MRLLYDGGGVEAHERSIYDNVDEHSIVLDGVLVDAFVDLFDRSGGDDAWDGADQQYSPRVPMVGWLALRDFVGCS